MDCDRISELPESLLTQILSYLPTKDSVKTSLLSKRWEFVWLSVPVLDLNANDLPVHNCKVFESFVDKFLEFNHDSRMQKFKIENHLWGYTYNRVEEWIGAAVDCGIQHLDVATRMGPYMPHNFYKSNTLVSLKLVFIGIKDPEFVVSLPCLKIMHLEDVWYELDPSNLEKLISGCPALEDLIVIKTIGDFNDDEDVMPLQFLRVRSQTLKIFRLMFKHCLYDEDYSVEIDAPRLEYLCFNDNQSDKIVIKNLNSLFMIDLDTEFMIETGSNFLIQEDSSKRDTIHDFLTGISSVRHMIISQLTLKVLYLYSEFGPIPKFVNLYRLDAAFSSSTLQLLPVFFESCPNLKILILDYDVSAQPEQVDLIYVPRCLISTLECVAINKLIMKEETGIKLVNYFIGNSAVLKRLTVSFTGSSKTYRLVPRAIYIQEPYCNYIY